MQGEKSLGVLFNSESPIYVDAGNQGAGLSLVSERGTTQRSVKAPKYWLSVLKDSVS